MNETTAILQVEDLCVDFHTRQGMVRVLYDINLSVYQGKTLGIVGESGCGKSMAALAIMRLIPEPPGSIPRGRILLEGRNLLDLDEKRMRDVRGNAISMIFQEPMTSLNPVFTVGMQISENIMRHQKASRSEAASRAVEIMQAVKIPAAAQRFRQYPHELSGGMRQRVMIAMALSCKPKVLIADEPTTALDVTVQAQIFDLLQEVREKTGTSMILITHDMGVISEVADRVAVIYAGHKVEEGSVREIIDDSLHPYTRGLIGCAPHLKEDPGPASES
ncbi:MAG: ABC transporter ATP-binding protein [Deltaproteobacteria bacterium]|nr:ABC transporter ATP-binding protein [Deltaproteobacteria bacterium]